jgi:glycosyltransferase involved in cell wall biosynthesis
MKICMVFYDMLEFGGLEEYATTLAVGLKQRGHQTSILSAAWVPPDNQYRHRLRQHEVPLVHLPKWLSYPASDWPTKEKILTKAMWLLTPLVYLLSVGLFLLRRRSWEQSRTSARNWLRGQLMSRLIGPDRRKLLTRLLLSWWRWRWRPDLLHIHGYTSSLLFAIDWAHAKRLPVVYEEHQTPDAQFDWWQGFGRTINKAARVIAVSEKSAEALRTVCGVTQPIVVRSPLLPDPMVAGWQKDARPRQGDEPVFLSTVARLYVTKGLEYLLEAIVQVRATYPNTRFRVFGDGPLRQDLLDYAGELGLDGEQIFVGAFSHQELESIMAQTDIFVMSSILEGQPLAVVEAMAYGCPIVTTAVGGIPELIQDGVNGLLCMPRDPGCLAQKIRALIEDPALRARLGHAARQSYEQGPFQPAAVCDHFISIYQGVLGKEDLKKGKDRGQSPALEGQPTDADNTVFHS